jgi:hypothetical protein
MVKFANGSRVKIHGSTWFDKAAVSLIPLYWKGTEVSNDWFTVANWYTNNSATAAAARLAAQTDNVYVVGSVRPIANIGGENVWVNPNSINVGTIGMGLSSENPVIVATNFRGTGTVSVSGRVTIDDPTQ